MRRFLTLMFPVAAVLIAIGASTIIYVAQLMEAGAL